MRSGFYPALAIVVATLPLSCKPASPQAASNSAGAHGESHGSELTGIMGSIDNFCRWANGGHDWEHIRTQALSHPAEYYQGVVMHGVLGVGHITSEYTVVPAGEELLHHFFARLGAHAAGASATTALAIASKALLAFEAMKMSCYTAYLGEAVKELVVANANAEKARQHGEDLDRYWCARINSLMEPRGGLPTWCERNPFGTGANKGFCARIRNAPNGGALVYDSRDFGKGLGYAGNGVAVRITDRWVHSGGSKLAVVKVQRESGKFDGQADEAWILPGYLEKAECR